MNKNKLYKILGILKFSKTSPMAKLITNFIKDNYMTIL